MSFNAVTAGNQTLASDINQYANSLNGTTSGAAILMNGGAGASTTLGAFFASVPTTGAYTYFNSYVTGDTSIRLTITLLTTGYASLNFGNGASQQANLYGISGGLKTDNALTVQGAATFNGGVTANSLSVTTSSANFAGLTSSSTVTANGGIAVSGTATSGGNNIAQFIGGLHLFTGTANPTGPAEGDAWIKGLKANPFSAIFGRGGYSKSFSSKHEISPRVFLPSSALDYSDAGDVW